MNKLGILSFLTVIASILAFFLLRGPNANMTIGIVILGTLSLLGIVSALFSKKWLAGIFGVLFNGMILTFAFLLLLAKGISEN